MKNDLSLVRDVSTELHAARFEAMLIGGWAEQLRGVAPPRDHGDIDLVVLDPRLDALDAFVAARTEIAEKRLSQKRAYLVGDVLVELFLAHWCDGGYVTTWWDRLEWSWPTDMEPDVIEGVPVAPTNVLARFRQCHPGFIAARPW